MFYLCIEKHDKNAIIKPKEIGSSLLDGWGMNAFQNAKPEIRSVINEMTQQRIPGIFVWVKYFLPNIYTCVAVDLNRNATYFVIGEGCLPDGVFLNLLESLLEIKKETFWMVQGIDALNVSQLSALKTWIDKRRLSQSFFIIPEHISSSLLTKIEGIVNKKKNLNKEKNWKSADIG